MNKKLALFAYVLILSGCNLSPRLEMPEMDIPCEWRFSQNTENTDSNQDWWQLLGDPVLDAYIQEAVDNNQDMAIALARVEQFYAQLGIAHSAYFPQISGNVVAAREEASLAFAPVGVGLKRIYNFYNPYLALNYQLDLWGQVWNSNRAAIADLHAQEAVRKTVLLTVVTSVASAYIELRDLDLQLEIAQQTVVSREESLLIAELRFQGGTTSELPVKQAAAELEGARTQVIQLLTAIPQQENLLSILMGRNPGYIERGKAVGNMPVPPCIPAGLPSELLLERPDIRQAEERIAAANARIGEARAAYFPNITLTGLFGAESLDLNNLFKKQAETWFYGASLVQPIFTAGLTRAQVAVQKAQLQEASAFYIQTIQKAFKEVEDALIAHRMSKELEIVLERRVNALQDALRLATLQYDNGQTDYLNVLDAERNLFNAQLDHAQAVGNRLLTFVAVYKALGGGWIDAIDPLNCQ